MAEDRAQKEFRVSRRVLFSETDVAGLVHFSNFFRYFEDAEHALWRQAGLSIHPERSPIGWPRVSASCEFHRPLKFEQEFEIAVRIAEMTKRTIAYTGEITRNGEKIAGAAWKIACVARLADGSIKSADIPGDVAGRLAPFAQRMADSG
ncbi:MAG TPA: thioesterase family protein [Vicinamibacterales bacterium]|nr:thioesterase family protein [Vicinamibacterales bacterium]